MSRLVATARKTLSSLADPEVRTGLILIGILAAVYLSMHLIPWSSL